MRDGLLIYGASGYTGRLIMQEALALGLRPVLGGRARSKLAALASPDRLDYRVAALEDHAAFDALLDGIGVVLNAAGPFRATAVPLARACIERGLHYLDISGEFTVFEALAGLGDQARRKGVMLLPGVGFDVVLTDSAAALVARRVPRAKSLTIGLTGLDAISRGSAETVFDQFAEPVTVRRGGQLVQVAPGDLMRDFDFGEGPKRTTALSWADVSSAYYSTGIPDITVYYDLTPVVELGLNLKRNAAWVLKTPGFRLLQGTMVRLLPDGPSSEARARGAAAFVVEAADARGHCCAALRVHTPEVYSFTALSSIAIADRVLSGDHTPGFQTPSMAFGPEYGLSMPGVTCTAHA
jgi:short subunit dehydrogenase-like uncharacterized protein